MPYMIPQNIKYEERLVGPLTLKQSIYAGLGCAIIMFALIFSGWPFVLKAIVTVVVGLLTIGFAMFDLEKYLINYIKFTRQPKRTSWISPAAKELLNIRAIRADSVFLRDGKVLSLVKVTPINFGVLSDSDRDSVIYGFLQFLNSLNFPVQIIMRSVNLDLDDYLRALKRRITKRDDKMALAYYEHFAAYINDFIKANKINDRLFYIVVKAPKRADERKMLEELDVACNQVTGTLGLSGIVAERLDSHRLINFYSSYFTETFELDENYLSPITMYKKMWQHAPENKPLDEATEKTEA